MGKTLRISEEKRMTTTGFVECLTHSFASYAKKGLVEKHPSVFVQGQPGIGKSQAVRQLADNLEKMLGKKVFVNDVRLMLFTPVDLRGIPVADMKERVAIWLIPEVFRFSDDERVINILFLDELTAAPSSLQAAAYQIALDRRLGEHRIPANTFIIAAGNRLGDNAIAYEMPTALRNRFIHFELMINLDEWINWAQINGIHPMVIEFLKSNPDKFSTDDFDTQSNIIVTPRSWEILSNLLNTLDGDVNDQEPYISGVIGTSLASLFLTSRDMIPIDDIAHGKVMDTPKTINELQRITDVLENRIEKYSHEKGSLTHILKYLSMLPMDYAIRIFRKIIKLKTEGFDIADTPEYKIFMEKLGEYKQYD